MGCSIPIRFVIFHSPILSLVYWLFHSYHLPSLFDSAEIVISDPLFRGDKHSAMQLTSMDTAIRFGTEVVIDVKPQPGFPDGIVLHFGQSRDARHQVSLHQFTNRIFNQN